MTPRCGSARCGARTFADDHASRLSFESANEVDSAAVSPGTKTSTPRFRVKLRRRGRIVSTLVLGSPVLLSFALDFARRPAALLTFPRGMKWYYRGSLLLTLVFWVILLWPAAARRGLTRHLFGGLFVIVFTLIHGTQGAFWSSFRTLATPDAEVYSRSILQTLVGTLPFGQWLVVYHFVGSALLGYLLVRLARRFVRPTRYQRWLAAPLVVLAFAAMVLVPASYRRAQTSVIASTPEHVYFRTLNVSYKQQLGIDKNKVLHRPQRRTPESVPSLTARPALPRNVLFVLQESQRPDATCIGYDPNCKAATVTSNRAVPHRMPLYQVRATDSSTTLSCSTLWTGLLPSDSERDLLSAPTLWRYAKAAGLHTSYFTSHFIIFHNMRMQMQDEPFDEFACATTFDQAADFDVGANDALLTKYAIEHWDALEEPFYSVVQYSNQHYPYLHDPKKTLFDETGLVKDSPAYKRAYYDNVVYLSDIAVGEFLAFVRASEKGSRTIIVFTSDHGEALGEHRTSGHTFSVYDNEIKVPAWIDAPPGTLTAEEEQNLRDSANQLLSHADFAPTMLDLIGVWDDPAIEPYRKRMVGMPMTRKERRTTPILLTNCSWLWECQRANWGAMAGSRKLLASQGAKKFSCFDVVNDPQEKRDLGEAACSGMRALVDSVFPSIEAPTRPLRPVR